MATGNEKYEKFLKKYHLEELTNKSDLDSVSKIYSELSGTGMMEFGASLTNLFGASKTEDLLTVYYLRTIIEQNFIMIRQLERISRAVGGEPEKKLSKMDEYLRKKQETVNDEQPKKEDMDIVIHMDPEKTESKMEAYLRKKQAAARNEK